MENYKNSKNNDGFEMDEISLKTPKISYNLEAYKSPKEIEKIEEIINRFFKYNFLYILDIQNFLPLVLYILSYFF